MLKVNWVKGLRFAYSFRSPERPTCSTQRGFTLVEIMVVIALIIVIAALAIPVSLRARLQSNETAAIGNLRTISSAAEAFRSATNPSAYPASFAAMASAVPPYLDSAWNTSNERQGYIYGFSAAANGDTFSATAAPRTLNVSGANSYCVDQTGVIRRYSRGGAVGGASGCNTSGTPI